MTVQAHAAVRRATTTDTPAVARSLARAFFDDPAITWLFPADSSRIEQAEKFFELSMVSLHLPHNEVWTTDSLVAAALWAPPGEWRTPLGTLLRNGPRLGRLLGRRVALALRGLSSMEAHHPRWPHWYLAILGTDPEWQGKGLGSAVMSPVLQRCDETGVGAYLESSKESNVPYYRRHGFEVVEELYLPSGPPLWLMWRAPRP